jgi:hypothetical protein
MIRFAALIHFAGLLDIRLEDEFQHVLKLVVDFGMGQ